MEDLLDPVTLGEGVNSVLPTCNAAYCVAKVKQLPGVAAGFTHPAAGVKRERWMV